MRRHQDARLEGHGRVAAERLHLAGLEGAQQLRLHGLRHLGDLVEEDRAGAGRTQDPLPASLGAGEGAALVAEQLALDHALRHRRQVHGQERLVAIGAQVVDEPRHDLLAGARLARDQDQRAGGGGPARPVEHLAHGP